MPEKIFSYHDGVFIERYDQMRKIKKNELKKDLFLENKLIVMHTGSLYPGRGGELFEVILKIS